MEMVGNDHADFGEKLQPGFVDIAIIRFFRQNNRMRADLFRQSCRSVHRKEHLSLAVSHFLHIFFLHHGQTFLADGIKDDLDVSVLAQHPQQAENLIFLEVVEKATGGDQERRIRYVGPDPLEPSIVKGVTS